MKKIVNKFEKEIAVLTALFLLFIIWQKSYKITCISLIIPLSFIFIIFKSSYDLRIKTKKCFMKCYFREDSLFYKIFSGNVFIFTISLIIAFTLAISLSLAIIGFGKLDFIIYFIDGFFLILLFNLIKSNNSFNKEIKNTILKNTTSWINGFMLSIIFVFISFNQKPPSYLDNTLLKTINNASIEVKSKCKYIDFPVEIAKGVVAAKWWLMIKASKEINNLKIRILMWGIFLLGNYLSIFAFSRFLLEILDLTIYKGDENERDIS